MGFVCDFAGECGEGVAARATAAFGIKAGGNGLHGGKQFEGGVLDGTVTTRLFEGESVAQAAAGGAQAVMVVFVAHGMILWPFGMQDAVEQVGFEDVQLRKADAAGVFGVDIGQAQFEVGDAACGKRQRRQFVVAQRLFGAGSGVVFIGDLQDVGADLFAATVGVVEADVFKARRGGGNGAGKVAHIGGEVVVADSEGGFVLVAEFAHAQAGCAAPTEGVCGERFQDVVRGAEAVVHGGAGTVEVVDEPGVAAVGAQCTHVAAVDVVLRHGFAVARGKCLPQGGGR